jgi:hypothetical protein
MRCETMNENNLLKNGVSTPTPHFDVKIVGIAENHLILHFWSSGTTELHIATRKLYYDANDCDEDNSGLFAVYLSNSSTQKTICFPEIKPKREYRTITFIVRDITNKEQFAVSIPFGTCEAAYTKMVYEIV